MSPTNSPKDEAMSISAQDMAASRERIIPCQNCGSEGVLIYARGNNPDHEREEPCLVCEGTGAEIIKTEPIEMEDLDDGYAKFRGKCKEPSEAAVDADPSLTLVRGHYFCPFWGEQAHWWTKRQDGTIHDPTKDQFPSKGNGEYVEFNGRVQCSECGKDMAEEEAEYEGNYCFCSYECHGRFVGVF